MYTLGLVKALMIFDYVGKFTRSFTNIDSNANQLKVFGLCRFLKLVFKNKPKRTEKNPYNQVGLKIFRVWGRESHKCLVDINNTYLKKEITSCKLDPTLIRMGLDVLTQNFWENYYNNQIYPAVDIITKETIQGLVERRDEYIKNEDFDLVKRVTDDINKVLQIGSQIFELQQALEKVLFKEDYDEAQVIKTKLNDLMHQRDNYDAKYQTFRFEQMITMDGKHIDEYNKQLEKEFEIIRRMKEEEERKKLLIEERNRMGKSFYRDEFIQTQLKDDPKFEKKLESVKNSAKKIDQGTPKPILKKKPKKSPEIKAKKAEEENFQSEGDRQLSKFLDPLLAQTRIDKKKLSEGIDEGIMSRLNTLGILDVFGYNLWMAAQNGDWKVRHAAASSVLNYIKSPLDKRFKINNYHLFLGCCELARVIIEDKVRDVSMVGLKILEKCFDPPICDEKIPVRKVTDALNDLFPCLRSKIAEKNKITSNKNLNTVLELMHKSRVDVNNVIEKNILDICEKEKDGRMFYKKDTKIYKLQPNILLPRLNILIELIKSFKIIDNTPSNIFMSFDLLVLNCLKHTDTDVKDAAFNASILFYQINDEKVRSAIEYIDDINPHYKDYILRKFDDADKALEMMKNGNKNIITTEPQPEKKTNAVNSKRPNRKKNNN